MPRLSADALLTRPISERAPKLDPLDSLGERQAQVWRAVVACMPADYFSSAQVHILAAYCSAVCVRQDIEAEIEAEQAKRRPNRKLVASLRRDLKGWYETENRLARSMRLTHQAVIHKETAGKKTRDGKQSAADILAEMNGT